VAKVKRLALFGHAQKAIIDVCLSGVKADSDVKAPILPVFDLGLRENVRARKARRMVFLYCLIPTTVARRFCFSKLIEVEDEISVRKFNFGVFHAAKTHLRHLARSVSEGECGGISHSPPGRKVLGSG